MSSVAHSHIWCNIAFPRIAHLALARNVVQFNDTLYLICFLNRKLAPPVWKYKSTKIPYVAKIHSVMQKTSGPWPMTSQWGTLKKGRGMKFWFQSSSVLSVNGFDVLWSKFDETTRKVSRNVFPKLSALLRTFLVFNSNYFIKLTAAPKTNPQQWKVCYLRRIILTICS